MARPSSILRSTIASPDRRALQPQDTRLEIMRGDPQIEPEANDLRLERQHLESRARDRCDDARDSGRREMQRGGEQTVGHHQVDGIGRSRRPVGEAMRELQRLAKFAVVELIDAQAPQRAQPISLSSSCSASSSVVAQAGPASRARPTPYISDQPSAADNCMRRRSASPALSSALPAPVRRARGIRQAATTAPITAPRRRSARCPIWRRPPAKTPSRAGAHIVDMAAVDGEPFVLRLRAALGLRARKSRDRYSA